ncbi:fungal-specific transcription factor domain-containing protein [Penicillium argentinense]|uniref:Fungal-specific transcription factor domain-containing protein n=1 Tax=Penicillium argentinense TaxID=1131581 RepID=A0A9W9KEU9_9EURO|nr:fungal-specific transcription factor domain-containing protein [Penicillium argentinense]KAJ5103108.1 fungal-specific transcription factor domain-containing protein [Penicillium argentinense]
MGLRRGVNWLGGRALFLILIPSPVKSDQSYELRRMNTYNATFNDLLGDILLSEPPADESLDLALHTDGPLISRNYLPRELDALDGQSRSLLLYFSDNIAPAMAAINNVLNGYRDMILPISEGDPTVRNAILAASASHLTETSGVEGNLHELSHGRHPRTESSNKRQRG